MPQHRHQGKTTSELRINPQSKIFTTVDKLVYWAVSVAITGCKRKTDSKTGTTPQKGNSFAIYINAFKPVMSY